MAASSYSRGAGFERDIKDELERAGYWVMRSSLSRGSADLLAIDLADPLTKVMIQCKRTKSASVGTAEWNQFYRIAMSTLSVPVIASAVFRGGTGPTAEHVVGRTLHRVMGPKPGGRQKYQPWVPWELTSLDTRLGRESLSGLARPQERNVQ